MTNSGENCLLSRFSGAAFTPEWASLIAGGNVRYTLNNDS